MWLVHRIHLESRLAALRKHLSGLLPRNIVLKITLGVFFNAFVNLWQILIQQPGTF